MLYIAEEVFFCGTASEITPIRSIDKIKINDGITGPITLALQREFFGIVKGTAPDRHHWFTKVSSEEPYQAAGRSLELRISFALFRGRHPELRQRSRGLISGGVAGRGLAFLSILSVPSWNSFHQSSERKLPSGPTRALMKARAS